MSDYETLSRIIRGGGRTERDRLRMDAQSFTRDPAGWIAAAETWTYASASTFTIAGDVTDIYQQGDKLRLKQGGAWKYFIVCSVSYGAPNTTITVYGMGTYTLANAAITDAYWSKAHHPTGWPQWLYPKRATMWHGESLVLTGNALLLHIDTSQEDNYTYCRNGSNNGDSGSHGLYLAAGTYTFSVLGQTRTNCGKVDWTLDGASIAAGQDWYSGQNTANVRKIVTGVVVPYSGWHRLVMTVNGTTAAGFGLYLTKYWFTPAAD